MNKLLHRWRPGQWGVLTLSIILITVTLPAALMFRAALDERQVFEAHPVLLRGAGPKDSLPVRGVNRAPGQVYQRIRESGGVISADYGFINFNNDPLAVTFSIPSRELAHYKLDYGYTKNERSAIDDWQKKAFEDAYQFAVRNRQSQEQLTKAGEKIAAEYRGRVSSFYRSRGFMLLEGNLLVADIPEIALRNVRGLRPVALALNRSGEKLGYDSDSFIAAALSLVQTSIHYETIPSEIGGRKTGGILPPLESIATGKGDCDTKVALLAAILLNWNRIKVVGVGVPGHYLMGVLRNPAKGDAFVEYNGLRYVLVEPAGPGWLPPGTVDKKTLALLNASAKVRIEPVMAN